MVSHGDTEEGDLERVPFSVVCVWGVFFWRVSIMKKVFCLAFVFLLLFPAILLSSESKALALLKGIESERMKYTSFRLCLTSTRNNKTISSEIDYDNGRIRIFDLPTDTFVGHSAILNGNEVIQFLNKDHEDARILASNSKDASVACLYDPRTIGLTDLEFYDMTVADTLLYPRFSGFTVEGGEFDGQAVKIVSVSNPGGHFKLYITEPGFRMLKKTYTSTFIGNDNPVLETSIINKYDNPKLGPFPSTIKVLRKKRGVISDDITTHITSFDEKASFTPDTFTYKGMNLPVNTALVDYRINRRLGYWDGEKLVENPVKMSAQEQREWEQKMNRQPLGNTVRYMLMGIGALMVLFAIISMIRKRLLNQT